MTYSSLELKPHGKYIYTKVDKAIDSRPLLNIHGAVGMEQGLIGFPHTSRTIMKLIELGFKGIIHPMDNPEVWVPSQNPTFEPFEYQLQTGKYITCFKNSWVLSGLGTGKTASCIWASNFLKTTKEIGKVLIICPLSTVERVWVKEIFTLYPRCSIGLITGSKKNKLSVLSRDYDYYVINHDGIRQPYLLEELKSINPDLIILDEATAMKNGSTGRFKALEELYNYSKPRLWAVTATPTPNGPQDMFAVQTLINPDTVPKSVAHWKNTTMWKIDRFKWVPRKGHEAIVKRAMKPAIRFVRDDIPDIGKPVEYDIPLTAEQAKIFNHIKDDMVAEIRGESDHTILAVNAAVKLSKLLQVCSGNVYDINKDIVRLPNIERLNTVTQVLNEVGIQHDTKAIIFVPFKNSQIQINNFLNKNKINTAMVNGDTSNANRNEIFKNFQEADDPRVLVAHPKVAAHGLTLTAASTIIWYGPMFSLEMYEQGNGRITRIGQKQKLTLVHIGSHKIEWDVYNVLQQRGNTQKAVLDLYSKIIKGE